MQSGFNIIQTIHILGEMEKEMEALKQLISLEQKINKIKEKKKQCKSISMASKSSDSNKRNRSKDDSTTVKQNGGTISGSKRRRSSPALSGDQATTNDTVEDDDDDNGAVENVTQDTFPYQSRYSSLCPLIRNHKYQCSVSTCDQEYYAKLLALNDAADSDFYLERVALLELEEENSIDKILPNDPFPRFNLTPSMTSFRMETHSWTNDKIRKKSERFFTKNFTLKPYISSEVCRHLTEEMTNQELTEYLGGLGLSNGQLLHYPFSLEEQLVIRDFLKKKQKLDPSICDRLPMRNLISIQVYLDDVLNNKSQYGYVLEYHERYEMSPSDPTSEWRKGHVRNRLHSGTVRFASFSELGHLVAVTGDKSNQVLLSTNYEQCTSIKLQSQVRAAMHSCNGRFLMLGCHDAVRIVNPACGSELLSIEYRHSINSIAPHPCYERYFAASSRDCKIMIWDVETGENKATVPTFLNVKTPVATEYSHIRFGQNISSDWLFGLSDSSNGKGCVTIFDFRSLSYDSDMRQNSVRVLPFGTRDISSFQLSGSGTVLATCSSSQLNLFDLRLKKDSHPLTQLNMKPCLTTQDTNISTCSFSNDDQYMCVSMRNSSHLVYDLRKSSRPVHKFEQNESPIHSSARYSTWGHSNGSTLLATSFHNTVALWDVSQPTNNEVVRMEANTPIVSFDFSPDDRRLVCATDADMSLFATKQ